MSLRTPIGRARGLGSAKDGVHHWWCQRVSAVALVPLIIWFVYRIAMLASKPYSELVQWVSQPLVAVLLILLFGSLFYHAAIGLQVVIEDYIKPEFSRVASIMLVKFLAFLLAVLGIFAVLKVALGA